MGICICDNCYHLKEEENEDGSIFCSCEYGFPSEECDTCEKEECDLTCEHLDPISETTVHCSRCGKAMSIYSKQEDGPYFCMDCYLKEDSSL